MRIGPSSRDGRLPEGRAGVMDGGLRPPAVTTASPRRGFCRSAQRRKRHDEWTGGLATIHVSPTPKPRVWVPELLVTKNLFDSQAARRLCSRAHAEGGSSW